MPDTSPKIQIRSAFEASSPFVAELIDFFQIHREEILERWIERIARLPHPSPLLQRQVGEVFLVLLTTHLEDTEDRSEKVGGFGMQEAISSGLTAADLSRAQIALKRAIIDTLIAAYPGDQQSLSIACTLVETHSDESVIGVSDLYYRLRYRGLTGELRAFEERYGTLVQTMNEGISTVDRESRFTFFNRRMEEITGYTKEEALNQHVSLIYKNESMDKTASEMEKHFNHGDASVYEVALTTKSGTRIPVSISGVPLRDDAGNLVGSMGVVSDISHRIESEKELVRRRNEIAHLLQLERKRSLQLTLVSEIAQLVSSTLDPDHLMHVSAESIQRNFEYHDVCVFILDDATEELVLRGHEGAYGEFLSEGYRQKMGVGIVGWVALNGEVLLANDVAMEPRRILAFPEERETRSELCVPIKLGDRTIGAIDVQSQRPAAFDEPDITSLEILASLIANAVENARHYQDMKFLKEFDEHVIDTIPMPLLFLDKALTIVSVNHAYCERRELDREDVEGRNLYEVAPDSILLRDDVLKPISTAIREGKSVNLMNVHRIEEFLSRVFNVFITPVEREQERLALVVFEDVTEIVEQAYQLSMLRQVSETMQGILELDRLLYALLTCVTAGTALGFNRAILLLIDRQRNVIEGKMGVGPGSHEEASRIWQDMAGQTDTIEDILTGYDRISERDEQPMTRLAHRINIPLSESSNLIVKAVEERSSTHVKDAFNNPEVTPELRDLLNSPEFVCVPLIAKQRAVGAVIADNLYSGRPISDKAVQLLTSFASQAGMAVENAEVYAQLADKIQELEEAYQKLQQAQDDLLKSERLAVVGEMSAHMAHEIRNPLTTIGGFARAIAKGTKPNRVQANARVVVEEVERLEKLLADTLSFTRPTPPDLKPTDMNQLVEDVFGLFKGVLHEDRVLVQKQMEPDLPGVVADPAQMKQVLLNLIQNALQAMPGGGSLKVSTLRSEGAVEVSVSDTGTGIPSETLNQIFDPFFTTKASGSGLGLAISRKIVEDHGGDISIESKQSTGATVTIRLPIRRNDS